MQEVRRRNIWISCYGVPLHGWSALTFRKIAQLWGEVIGMDEATTKGLSFAAGKVLIATEHWDRIDEVIHVEVKGRIFEVKVVEEQVVVHDHCSTCNLTFSESTRANSTQKRDDSAADSVGEASSRREVVHGVWGDNRKAINDLKEVSRVEDSNLEILVDNLAAEVTEGVKEGERPILSSSPKEDSLEDGEIRDKSSRSLTDAMGDVNHVDPGPINFGEVYKDSGPQNRDVVGGCNMVGLRPTIQLNGVDSGFGPIEGSLEDGYNSNELGLVNLVGDVNPTFGPVKDTPDPNEPFIFSSLSESGPDLNTRGRVGIWVKSLF
ncbi:hypothetical protein Vadar_032815 [Vaccinium darrowii]|uniref:Uncharacterized protein n=1 Tax=Vaccinium darrowii TaxID=229202 RepID=A0ACB7Y4Q6_9ERIC|nr:hypothetical protein Vadar_032815 [Vaccinium darrowii]